VGNGGRTWRDSDSGETPFVGVGREAIAKTRVILLQTTHHHSAVELGRRRIQPRRPSHCLNIFSMGLCELHETRFIPLGTQLVILR
jgi:hypothetical protein